MRSSSANTASSPPAASAHSTVRPTSAAWAPSARARNTSTPVAIPPSRNSGAPTGSIAARASAAPIMPSSTRPPWFDTTTPAAPSSTARRASPTIEHALHHHRHPGPGHEIGEVVPDDPRAHRRLVAVVGVRHAGRQPHRAPERREAARRRHVDRQDDHARPGRDRPTDDPPVRVGVGERVELEPQVEAGDGADLLDRHRAAQRQDHRHARPAPRPAPWPARRRGAPCAGRPSGRSPTAGRSRGRATTVVVVDRRHVDERARHDPPAIERPAVLGPCLTRRRRRRVT